MTEWQVRKAQLSVINQLEIRKQFLDSNYSSYGWFLRSLGIIINSREIRILDDSEYKNQENLIKLYANIGEPTL